MRIGIFNPYLDTMSGGEKYILTLASVLSEKHSVFLFWDLKDEARIREKAKTRFGMDFEKVTFVDNIFSSKTGIIKRLQESRNYDRIIYLSDGSIPFLLTPLILHFQSPMEWLASLNLKDKLKLINVKTIICNSKFTKYYIDKKFKKSSEVLYPPVNIQKKYDKSKKDNIILNVGRFGVNTSGSSYKKQDVLAKAFKQMVDDGLKNWSLIFVVSVLDDNLDSALQFSKEMENYPIKVIINPPNSVLWDNYQKADIYWHGSGYGEDIKNNPDRAEHFGISTVEAMGSGAIPIVFKAGGQIEIVHHNNNGFLWETIEQLIKDTLRVIESKNNTKIINNAVETAILYSVENFSKKALTLI